MRIDGELSNAFGPFGQSVPSLMGLRVTLDVDELAGLGVDELAAADGAVGTQPSVTVAPRSREDFSAVRGLKAESEVATVFEWATNGKLNVIISILSVDGLRKA